jgi:hypothetical protein
MLRRYHLSEVVEEFVMSTPRMTRIGGPTASVEVATVIR